MIFSIILLICLGFSMLLNVGGLFGGMLHGGTSRYAVRTSGPKLDEFVREDNSASDKIAVVEVKGLITSGMFEQGGVGMVELIKAQLKHAEEDSRVKAVILKVDSPGGEVLASDEIYRAISDFQKTSRKPVIASMGSLAASGGYYVSAPCRWIVANELTITGSIGVIMSSWNYRGLMDKVGVVPQVYKSGKFKDMLSGSRPPNDITPQERQMLQGLIDETFSKFKSVVQEGRAQAYEANGKNSQDKGRQLSESWQELADGRVLSGTEALRNGFVDELGGFDDAVSRAKKIAGVREANLVEYHQRYDFADLFRIFGKTDAKGVKIDLGMELPRLQTGQLYFLSPTYIQ